MITELIFIIWTTLCTTIAVAEEPIKLINKEGLVCRRADLYFSRPYYLIFHQETVLGPWVTIDTAERLRHLEKTKYHTSSSSISWSDYTLTLNTLQLEFRGSDISTKVWKCERMDVEHLELAILRRQQKISK